MKTFLRIVAVLVVLLFAAPSLGAGPPSMLEGGVQTFNTDLKVNGDFTVLGIISGTVAPVGDLTIPGDLFVDGGDVGLTTDPDLLQFVNGALTVNGTGEFNGNISLEHPGVSSDSRKIFFYADVAAASKVGSIYVAADVGIGASGLVISVPDIATGVETPVFAILSTVFGFAIDGTVDIGATGSFRPKDIYLSGDLNAEAGDVIANGNLTATTGNLSVPLGTGTFGGDVFIGNGGTDTHSYLLRLQGNAGGEQQYGGLKIDYTIPALVLAGPSGVGGGWTEVLQVAGDGYLTFVAAEGNIGVTGDEELLYLGVDEVTVDGDIIIGGYASMSGDLIVNGGDIGLTDDTDLIQMAYAAGFTSVVTVNGSLILGVPVWEDMRVPLTSAPVGPGNNPGFDVFQGAIRQYAFDPNTEEELFFTSQLPHGYKYGTDLHAHIHWAPKTTDTGDCRWCVEYSIAEMDGTFGAPTTICNVDAGDGTAFKHQYADIDDIDGSAIDTLSAAIAGRVYRDADAGGIDTFTGDAYGIELDFHYQKDTLGSFDEFNKIDPGP